MNLKNITLNTAELGPVNWEDVEKIQPSNGGFICFVSSRQETRQNEDGEEYSILIGEYIHTDFDHIPSYKELINFIIQKEYPNGKESQMLRLGIHDPQNQEYLDYYDNVEEISSEIKSLLN